MKFSEDSTERVNRLHSYGAGWIRVNEQRLERGFIISAENLITDWEPEKYAELKPEHLNTVFKVKAELILIGTGQHQQLPGPDIYRALINNKTGFEFMTTDAACRTYNVLLSESRDVVAILFPE
ncbi:MAG: Mth938-like domain-containing protein [Thiolinea sp.]